MKTIYSLADMRTRDKTRTQKKGYEARLDEAVIKYQTGDYFSALDLLEQMIIDYPDEVIFLLNQVYAWGQEKRNQNRYSLYLGRLFEFKFSETAKVLDVGSGHMPFPFATHLLDLSSENDHLGRRGMPFCKMEGRYHVESDMTAMPFEDNEIDFLMCSHAIQYAKDPIKACEEIQRVAKQGMFEFPKPHKEIIFSMMQHDVFKWFVTLEGERLVFKKPTEDEKFGLGTNLMQQMMLKPQTERERAYSALFFLKPKMFNTFFYWKDSFSCVIE